MKQSTIIIWISAAIMVAIAFIVGGSTLVIEGLRISLNTAYISLLMLIVSFIIIGQLNILLTIETLKQWLEKFNGIKAIIVSAFAGGLFPGGPYVYYPFILSFKEKNLPFYILISFIFGKQVYDFSRLPMEASLVSPNIAIIRTIITMPIPIVVGLLAQRFYSDDDPLNPTDIKEGEDDGSDDSNS